MPVVFFTVGWGRLCFVSGITEQLGMDVIPMLLSTDPLSPLAFKHCYNLQGAMDEGEVSDPFGQSVNYGAVGGI